MYYHSAYTLAGGYAQGSLLYTTSSMVLLYSKVTFASRSCPTLRNLIVKEV